MPINYFTSEEKNEPKTRKAKAFLFIVFAIFLIFFSFRQLKNNIYNPFSFMNKDTGSLSVGENQLVSLYNLQEMDTDGDGLSDYDEIYIYGTSPYLADTDSDGISDYDEIMRGTDPLCPEGQDCSIFSDSFIIDPNENINIPGDYKDYEGEYDEELAIIEGIIRGEADVSMLRELLFANGFDKKELDQISDEDLQLAYFEAISEQLTNQD